MTNSVMDISDHTGPVVSGEFEVERLEESLNSEELWDASPDCGWILLEPDILASLLRNNLDKVRSSTLESSQFLLQVLLVKPLVILSVAFGCFHL